MASETELVERMDRRAPRAGGGFTLVELLVVIAVVAILVAVLIPALEEARRQGRLVMCGSNLRQIATAFNTYATDWQGWYPARDPKATHPRAWRQMHAGSLHYSEEDKIEPYLQDEENVTTCPFAHTTLGNMREPFHRGGDPYNTWNKRGKWQYEMMGYVPFAGFSARKIKSGILAGIGDDTFGYAGGTSRLWDKGDGPRDLREAWSYCVPHRQTRARPRMSLVGDLLRYNWSNSGKQLKHFDGFHFERTIGHAGLLSAAEGTMPNDRGWRIYEVEPKNKTSFPRFNFARMDGSVASPKDSNAPIAHRHDWLYLWAYLGDDYPVE